MKWENPRCEWSTSFVPSFDSIRAVSSRSSVQYITKSRWKLCWVAQRSFFILENLEWYETETHTWKINNQETRQTFTYTPCSYALVIDATIQHLKTQFVGLCQRAWRSRIRLASMDLTSSDLMKLPIFVSRSVSFRCQDECLLQGTGHHPSIHPTTLQTLQSWKNVTRGLRPWRCVFNRNLCLCHLCPRWCQRILWILWCRSHITSYLERRRKAALGGSIFCISQPGLQLRIFQGHERLIYHCSRGESMWNTISSTGISIKTKGIK